MLTSQVCRSRGQTGLIRHNAAMTALDWIGVAASVCLLVNAILQIYVAKTNATTSLRNREIARQNVAVAESLATVSRSVWRARDGEHP